MIGELFSKTLYSYTKTQTLKNRFSQNEIGEYSWHIMFLKGRIEYYIYSRVGIEDKAM